MSEHILVVDDEREITDLIGVYLKNDGYEVTSCYDAAGALEAVGRETFDLALLDIMLPDMDGFDLCAKIREEHLFPIIFLTAKVADIDKIRGLSVGADDYVTKPFNAMELMARVRAQLRRNSKYNIGKKEEQDVIDIRGMSIDRTSRRCTVDGRLLDLTPTEFNLLWELSANQGKVIPSEELFERVWKEKYFDSNNTIMAHVSRIRSKMNDNGKKPKYIKTVWGVGYTIE